MKKVTLVSFLILGGAYLPTDTERARWTLQDMRSWKIALEAYKLDQNEYPAAATIGEAAAAVEPRYIRKAPRTDAWGRPYIYERVGNGFLLISAGADAKLDRESWNDPAKDLGVDADAVVSDTAKFWLRSWKFE